MIFEMDYTEPRPDSIFDNPIPAEAGRKVEIETSLFLADGQIMDVQLHPEEEGVKVLTIHTFEERVAPFIADHGEVAVRVVEGQR